MWVNKEDLSQDPSAHARPRTCNTQYAAQYEVVTPMLLSIQVFSAVRTCRYCNSKTYTGKEAKLFLS